MCLILFRSYLTFNLIELIYCTLSLDDLSVVNLMLISVIRRPLWNRVDSLPLKIVLFAFVSPVPRGVSLWLRLLKPYFLNVVIWRCQATRCWDLIVYVYDQIISIDCCLLILILFREVLFEVHWLGGHRLVSVFLKPFWSVVLLRDSVEVRVFVWLPSVLLHDACLFVAENHLSRGISVYREEGLVVATSFWVW